MKKTLFIFCLFFSLTARAETTDKLLLTEMLTALSSDYLYPLRLDDSVNMGLQALTDLDKRLTVSKGSNRFYLYVDRQLKKSVPFPKDAESIQGWADTAAQVINAAAAVSETVAVKDFEVPDLMMKKITASLDKYSHYSSEYDYSEEQENNAIYTLYSERNIDDILYLRVRIFNKQTAKQIQDSLKRYPNIQGVILDLRGNSGGILNEALKTADFFSDNEIITYTAGRDGANTHYYTAQEGELYSGPLAVITDGDTASAAEVLAAGLQEQSRAKIIGTRTFGKGTIQNIIQMRNGGKLVLTTEQFFTPSGKIIHQNGVTPDVCLALSDDGDCLRESRLRRDEDIQTAIKVLKNDF